MENKFYLISVELGGGGYVNFILINNIYLSKESHRGNREESTCWDLKMKTDLLIGCLKGCLNEHDPFILRVCSSTCAVLYLLVICDSVNLTLACG